MKKRMMMFTAVVVFALALAACGTAQTSENPTPTIEPEQEVEASTEPTVEPVAKNTSAPTATPEPTATS